MENSKLIKMLNNYIENLYAKTDDLGDLSDKYFEEARKSYADMKKESDSIKKANFEADWIYCKAKQDMYDNLQAQIVGEIETLKQIILKASK